MAASLAQGCSSGNVCYKALGLLFFPYYDGENSLGDQKKGKTRMAAVWESRPDCLTVLGKVLNLRRQDEDISVRIFSRI